MILGPILVFLPHGVQGGAVLRAALRRGYRVRALSRSPDVDRRIPGCDWLEGDLDDPASLAAAMEGVAHLVLQVPTGEQAVMARRAEHVLRAAKAAGVRSIVLKLASASRPAPCPEPSFVANHAVEARVRGAGLPFAVLRPTFYLDNLLKPSALADLAAGVLTLPVAADRRIAWTSADDCAEGAIRLLELGRFGGDHRIAGSRAVTGDELAACLAACLGRSIRYRVERVEDFEREVEAALGMNTALRVASKFRYLGDQPEDADHILGGLADADDTIPGFAPMSIEAWIADHRDRLTGGAIGRHGR